MYQKFYPDEGDAHGCGFNQRSLKCERGLSWADVYVSIILLILSTFWGLVYFLGF